MTVLVHQRWRSMSREPETQSAGAIHIRAQDKRQHWSSSNVQPRQRKAEHQDVDKKEGKVLRVFSSGRWLPRWTGMLLRARGIAPAASVLFLGVAGARLVKIPSNINFKLPLEQDHQIRTERQEPQKIDTVNISR